MGEQPVKTRPTEGFILIYTLWVLAACSVLLALLARSAVQPIAVNEASLNEPLALVEEINILDYVLAHTFSYDLPVDPRFVEYQQEITTETIKDKRGIIQELKDMLSQLGMELNIDDDSEAATETTSETVTATAAEEADGPPTLRQNRLFNITGEPLRIKPGEFEYRILLRPANALPGINRLPREAMIRYLVHLGLERESAHRLAGVIHDWRDADDFVSEGGAESAQYPFGHTPRNGPIQSWSEIHYLKGSSSQLIEFLRSHFTLSSRQPKISANYLDAGALAAITDIPPDEVIIALENEALEEDEKLPLNELIGDDHAEQFNALVDWEDDRQIVLATVSGPFRRVSALFDISQRQIIDWYLDLRPATTDTSDSLQQSNQ